MSLFGKKQEFPPFAPTVRPSSGAGVPGRPYGVGDLIQLMKTISLDEHPDLVVRVIKTTLESLGVQTSDVLEDASKQRQAIQQQIAAVEGEIEGLTKEIQHRRDKIGQLQLDLAETTYARERLLSAEKASPPPVPGEPGSANPKPRSLPPPLPPILKSGTGKPQPPEPATGT